MGDLDGKVTLDTTNYKSGLADMNRALKMVESGFKAQSAVMGDWDKNVDGLAMRSQALSREIDLQAHKVSELSRVYRELAAGGKTSQKELDFLQISINQETEKLGKMQSELRQTDTAMAGLKTETKGTTTEQKKLGTETDKTGRKLISFKGVVSGVGNVVRLGAKAMVGATAAALGLGLSAAAGLSGLTVGTAEAADELNDLSLKTGISVERLQELGYAGGQIGTDLDTMTGSLTKLTRSMGASGDKNSEQAKAFKELGVSVTDASGNLRDRESVFYDTIDALGRMTNETEMDIVAQKLLGKSAEELNPLIKAGGGELARLSQEARTMGAVMGEDDVKAAADFADQLDGLKRGLSGVAMQVGAAFMPALSGLATEAGGYLAQFAAVIKNSNGDPTAMAAGAGQIVGGLVGNIAKQLPEFLKGGLAIVKGILQAVIDNLPQLVTAAVEMITTIVTFMTDNAEMLINAGVLLITTLATALGQNAPTLMPAIVQAMVTIVGTLIENIPMMLTAAAQLIGGLAQGLIDSIPALVNSIPPMIAGIKKAFEDNWPTFLSTGQQIVTQLWNGILSMGDKFSSDVKAWVNGIVKSVLGSVSFGGVGKPGGTGPSTGSGSGTGSVGGTGSASTGSGSGTGSGNAKGDRNPLIGGVGNDVMTQLQAQVGMALGVSGAAAAGASYSQNSYSFFAPVTIAGESGKRISKATRARRYS